MKTQLFLLALAASVLTSCTSTATEAKELESHRANDLVIALASEKSDLTQGQNRFFLNFRSASTNQPVNVGTVSISSSMSMPGMAPMPAEIEVQPAAQVGKYPVTANFGMSGSWKFDVRWNGPAGQGSTTFNTDVR